MSVNINNIIVKVYKTNLTTKIIIKTVYNIDVIAWLPAFYKGFKDVKFNKYKYINNKVYFRNKVYIPNYIRLNLQIIHKIYTLLYAGN